MMSILGCSAGELGHVLQALGFRLDRVRIEPDAIKPLGDTAADRAPETQTDAQASPARRGGTAL